MRGFDLNHVMAVIGINGLLGEFGDISIGSNENVFAAGAHQLRCAAVTDYLEQVSAVGQTLSGNSVARI